VIHSRKRKLLRVGLTGGIGSGKSLVAVMFKGLGVPVLSADEIARSLTETDEIVRRAIRRQFGSTVFRKDGSLDRKRLADVIFSNKDERETLNAIVHPLVLKKIEEEITESEKRSHARLVIHEAALIYEAGADKDLDYVVFVDADEETRIRRVIERDGISRAEVSRRIDSQMPAERKKELADFVLTNDGDTKSLERRVKFLFDLFLKIGETRKA
jgi:dephospho-CoA kinase